MFENFPYSNFHDLNTDWINKKIGDIDRAEANAKASEENAKASELNASLSDASAQTWALQANNSAKRASEQAQASAQSAAEADNYVTSTRDQVNLLQSRVDNIIPSGTQTEGNTELLDIRVGYNGVKYTSAGDAVRNQVEDLHDIIGNYENNLFTMTGTTSASYGTLTKNIYNTTPAPQGNYIAYIDSVTGSPIRKLTIYGYIGSEFTTLAEIIGINKYVQFVINATYDRLYLFAEFEGMNVSVNLNLVMGLLDGINITTDLLEIGKTVYSFSDNIASLNTLTQSINTKINTQNTITVAKTGGDYQTINSAVTYAKTIANVNNPVTIVINPGIYDEVVNIGENKYISLVGVNRDTCIIRDQSGRYANSPLLINGTFTIENLTIIANHDNAGSWYPTWVVGQNSTFASYCVHTDGGIGTAENPQYGHFINCTFYSECGHAIGSGIHPYQTLCFENCEIVRNVSDSNYLNENYLGAMGCHSEVTRPVEEEAEENLILKNCEITFNDSKALQLWHYHAGSPMTVTAIGCTLEDGTGVTNVIYYKRGTKSDYLTMKCHGNNTSELNY